MGYTSGCMAEQSGEFAGLAALVTGGASGIGLATARLLAGRGARVAVLDLDRGFEPVGAGTGLYPVLADVTDDAAVRAAVAEAGRVLGRLDIVVNNAGIGAAGTVEDNDDAEWHRVLDVNVLGIVRTTRAALPLLRQAARERGQAAIVNTCSVAATAGLPQRALYSATKGAVYSLTLAMAADYVAEGIRVNCVTPGTADTPWVGRHGQRERVDRALGRAVERPLRQARGGRDRAGVDDRGLAALPRRLAEQWQRGPRGAHDAEHVHVEHPVPLGVVVVLDRPGRADARVVHHDVEPAESPPGLGDGGAHRGVVGHVGEDRVKVGPFAVYIHPVQHGHAGAAVRQ